MKKFYLTLWVVTLWLCTWAQEKDSLKIIYTNDLGLIDLDYKPPVWTKNLFKENNYYKGRLLVKFKNEMLNPELVGDKSRYTNVAKLIVQNTKPTDTNRLFKELETEITAYRMLTSLSPDAKKNWLEKYKDSTKIKPLDDVFYITIIYCKEGNEELLANKLLKLGLVDYAEPDQIMYLTTPPNDPQYWQQRGWNQFSDIDIDVETAWQTQTGSPNVKVAILDTGIDYNNDDLGNGTWNTSGAKVRTGYNYHNNNSNPFDNDITSSHGTAVAGIVGAYRNNGIRISGIAGGDVANGNNGVTLYALKVFSGTDGTSKATGSSSDMSAALVDAAKPEILGGYGCNVANYSGGSLDATSVNTVKAALRYAARNNLLFVAAKGNDNTNAMHFPSDYKNNWVLSVGASDAVDQRASFSNWGNGIDVVAPGVSSLVYTTKRVAQGSEGTFNGTSAAAPVVAGVAALLKSQNVNLHRDDMEQLIKMSAEKVPGYTYTNGYNEQMGFGRVNAGNAINYLKSPYKLIQKTEIGGTVEDVSSSQWFIFNDGVPLTNSNYGKRYRIKRTVQKPFCSGENYFWTRIEGASLGWSGANPNNQENFVLVSNETATTVDLTTWVYYIENNSIGQNINAWFPCAPQDVQFAYTALGLEGNEIITPSISGPSQICSTTPFNIPNLPTGATVTWSVTGSYIISGPNTANPVTVQRTSNGYGVLTANITTNCGAYTVTKNLSPLAITFSAWGSGNGPCGEGSASVDIPPGNTFNWEVTGDLTINGGGQTLTTTDNIIAITGTNGTIIVTTSACGSPIYLDYNYEPYKRDIIVAANPMIGSDPLSASIQYIDFPYTEIKWYIDGVQVYNPWANPEMFIDTSNPPCGTHVLSAKAVLTCGATVDIGSVDIERYCSGWWRSMVIYPNPASSYLNIQPDAEKLKTLSATEKSTMKEYEASLYDMNGKLLLKGKSNGYKLNLDTRHLKSDNYFIHIKIDGEKEMIKKQVIIRN